MTADWAREDAYSKPLGDYEISHWDYWQNDVIWPYFERLRAEAPVHYTPESRYGPYWSVTRFDDIKAIDGNHPVFSSENGITIAVGSPEFETRSFIGMDQPEHDVQRKTVTPVVAPRNLAALEGIIRQRAGDILDGLPVGEPFNWVQRVSIELTTQMLATLFDFPFEQRSKLTFWSDVATGGRQSGLVNSAEEARAELLDCLRVFTELWHERKNEPPKFDLISMLANGETTKDIVDRPMEYLGNLMLLIIGGNDTTRNSISGGVLALNKYPDQYDMLRADHSLIPNMVAEIIRWQTPLSHMARTALEDFDMHGQTIRKGDKVVMWYVSGNRDESVFDDADDLIIDRRNARSHVSFGFGIHRCMGNRLAEMQLRVLWEEIMQRFHKVEVVGAPVRVRSNFVRGYAELPVVLHPN